MKGDHETRTAVSLEIHFSGYGSFLLRRRCPDKCCAGLENFFLAQVRLWGREMIEMGRGIEEEWEEGMLSAWGSSQTSL